MNRLCHGINRAGGVMLLLLVAHACPPAAAVATVDRVHYLDAVAAIPADTSQAMPDSWLQRVYATETGGPVWFTTSGQRPAVATALRALHAADEHGLDPDDYDVPSLQRRIAALSGDGVSAEEWAKADVAMTVAVLHFVSDLRFGRVRPQDVEPHYSAPARDANFVEALRHAVASDTFEALVQSAEPRFPVYGRLKQLLARYRMLGGRPTSVLPAIRSANGKIVPGDSYEGVPEVHERLLQLGDLEHDAPAPANDRYTQMLADAVRRFQERHGLQVDGVLGKETIAALNIPIATRTNQIVLSLERLRWLPDLRPGPALAINVPSFRLWAFSEGPAGHPPALSMPVIVGRAMRHETPMFLGEMRVVEFSPYWNVPRNILRNELLPRLATDAEVLARDDMEIVSATGQRVAQVDAATMALLRSGELRLRQRPGPKNALGGVKFVLPNTMDIYLHGTPARQLFERTRRDFSHGCIRVLNPVELAQFVLSDQPQWTRAAIDSAMAAGAPRTVKLAAPVPVVVFYTTALVDSAGTARFLPDVYGHDRKLANALRHSRAARTAAP